MLMEEAVSGVHLRLTAAWKMASRGNALGVHLQAVLPAWVLIRLWEPRWVTHPCWQEL